MASPVISPEIEAMLRQKLKELKAELATVFNKAFDKAFDSLKAPLPAPPPAPKLPPPTQSELPPLPTPLAPPAPKQTPAHPPPLSVEALEEVEHIQVYKPVRNIKKQPIRQKHRAAKAIPKTPCDAEVFEVFGNIIAWPPKFGGTNVRLSRDEQPDAWYTTMLNTHANELATRALLNRA